MTSASQHDYGRLAPQQHSIRLTRSTETMPPSPGLTYSSSQDSGSPRILHNMHSFSDAWDQHNDTVTPSFSDSSLARVMAPPSASKHTAQPSVTMIPLAPNKRRRIRVESTPNHTQPGFPYRNSTNLLPRFSQSSRSSGDSSDEVDLDLSYDYDPIIPVTDSRATSAMSGNRSVSRLDPYDDREDPGATENTLDPTAGWSYNSTPAISRPPSTYPESEVGGSLHSKRRGVSPLRILLGSSGSSRASSPASTPTSFNFRRGSKGTELSSPLSDALRTPRTPTDILHSSVRIADPDSLGSSRGRSIMSHQQYEIADYKAISPTRAAFPYNLFSSLRTQSTSAASTPTSSHFPASTTVDMEESPALPESLRPAELAGLGFRSSHHPPNHSSVPSLTVRQAEPQQPKSPLSPLSPSSPASPSPGSPLLGAESGPAVHFDHDPYQDVLRDPSPAGSKPLWLVNNHQRTASSVGAHRHKRSLSRKLSRRFSVSTLRHHPTTEVLPARSLFLLGFLLGPWCWLLGGFFLRPDGELYGSRKEVCRCGPGVKTCPVDVRREMRLMGIYASGDGLECDVMQLDPEIRKAMHVQRGTQGHVVANRTAAVVSGLGVGVIFGVAIWMVVLHW